APNGAPARYLPPRPYAILRRYRSVFADAKGFLSGQTGDERRRMGGAPPILYVGVAGFDARAAAAVAVAAGYFVVYGDDARAAVHHAADVDDPHRFGAPRGVGGGCGAA